MVPDTGSQKNSSKGKKRELLLIELAVIQKHQKH